MLTRAAVNRACVAIGTAGALLAGCGGAGPSGAGRTQPAASAAIAIARPADGGRLRALQTPGGMLRARTRVRGSAQPGSAVHLRANCRPRPCLRRVVTASDGRWSASMTLTTTRAGRFTTIDAGSGARAAPAAVTTIELVGPPRAPARAARRTPRAAAPAVRREPIVTNDDGSVAATQRAPRAAADMLHIASYSKPQPRQTVEAKLAVKSPATTARKIATQSKPITAAKPVKTASADPLGPLSAPARKANSYAAASDPARTTTNTAKEPGSRR